MFNSCSDWNQFKSTVRDLLISTKEFASKEDDLYAEEREVSRRKVM